MIILSLVIYVDTNFRFMLSIVILFRYVGNIIHVQVTDRLRQEVFQSTGLVEGCKLIRKEKVVFYIYKFILSLIG